MSESSSTPLPTSGSRLHEGDNDHSLTDSDLTGGLDLSFDGAEDVLRAWRRGMRPDADLTVSEWADAHRWLSSRASAEPGRYRTARTPYLRAIMDALSPSHPAQRISFMKAAQVGATEAGNNWIGFVIHHAPGPMLAVLPTVEMAKRTSRGRISVRGLATALVVLRGALIRTGIGALIVGAGELVYQFGRLVSGAGGFGAALELMGNVARAVWDGMAASMSAFSDRFRAMRADIEALWLRLMRFLGQTWADFLSRIAPGFNQIADVIGAGFQIDALGVQAWVSSFDAGIMRAERSATAFRARADATLASAFDGAREAMAALLAAVRGSGEESAVALDAATAGAQRMSDTLDQAEAAAGRAGAAGRQAGSDTATVATEALTGWQAVTAALSDYADKARDIGADIGQALVGAFGAAENAVADFVRKGKLDFRDLVTSMIADLARLAARRFILGPLAGLLSGVLGGAGGLFANIFHAGGVVGGPAPGRMVPAMAFAGAPQMHSGGWAGLKPDEVPAILQRGERVLSRREAAGYGGRGGDGGTTVNVTIMARDAESFRQSRTQVAADIARAVNLGRRGM